jgi:5-formyltetrahydrofolate cyclo-ligase
MDKAQLRRDLQKRLLTMTTEQRTDKSRKACRNLISTAEFQNASTIMLYLSLPHEVDTSEAILHAWQLSKIIAVPKISWQQRHMIPVQINSLETDCTTGVSGLRNPVTGVPVPVKEIGLVVAPALGFDKKGNRLGRGGSFYDRFFANEELHAARCGLAFEEQILDAIPAAESDEPVDFLITDEQVIYFTSQKGD